MSVAAVFEPPPSVSRCIPGDGIAVTPRSGQDWTSIPVHQGFAEMDLETQELQDKAANERNTLSEEQKAEADVDTWDWGASLRSQWAASQRADPSQASHFDKLAKSQEGFRVAVDGCLEFEIESTSKKTSWVPVVPNGFATNHLRWKKWVFPQHHVGVF